MGIHAPIFVGRVLLFLFLTNLSFFPPLFQELTELQHENVVALLDCKVKYVSLG